MKEKILTEIMSLHRPGLDALAGYLVTSDFFTAPASTRYHLAAPGGLAQHSWNVYQQLDLLQKRWHVAEDRESLVFCGLLHDVCKVNFYAPDPANPPYYKVREKEPLGHGEKSVIVLQRYTRLTEDEALAIRWHMGAWDAESAGQRRSLNQAIEKSPLLRALMIADQTATFLAESRAEVQP